MFSDCAMNGKNVIDGVGADQFCLEALVTCGFGETGQEPPCHPLGSTHGSGLT